MNLYEEYKKEHMPEEKETSPVVEYNGWDSRAKKEFEYLGKSANVGLAKASDFITPKSNESYKYSDDPKKREIYRKDKESKQEVLDAMEERDAFYMANEKDFTFAHRILGGIVESVCNPIEDVAQIGIAVATGGTSIPVQLGSQLAFDITQANYESKRYENRYLTAKENIYVGLMSIAPDLIFKGVGAGIRKLKGDMLDSSYLSGNQTVSVRKTMEGLDDMGIYDGATKQSMYTNYKDRGILIESDPYKLKDGKLIEIDIDNATDFSPKIMRPIDYQEEVMANSLGISKDNVSSLRRLKNEDPIMFKEIVGDTPSETLLQRTVGDYEFSGTTALDYELFYNNITPEQYDIAMNALNEKYGKGFVNKDNIQRAVIVQNKENDLLDKFAQDVKPTLDYYYSQWKKQTDKNPNAIPNISLNTEQIDLSLNNINTRFNTQKLYVQNEYMNILNKGYDDTPITLNQYIDIVGKDETTIANAWVKGNFEGFDGNRNNFLREAYKDSVILDELNMKNSLFDMKEFDTFSKKYGSSFDVYGDIKYDGNLFETLAKAKGTDKEIIIRAMQDNPQQYAEFIYNSKKILDGGQGTVANKELMNKATEELKDLKVKKSQYKLDNLDSKIDSVNDIYSNNVNSLNSKIKDAENAIKDLESKKVKGKKQKIQELNDTIEDLKAQIKNEDLALRNKKAEIKENYNKEYLDKEIQDKKSYIDKLKEVKEEVSKGDIKKFEEYFNVPFENVKKYVNKNKEFINTEFDKLVNEVPLDKSTDPKIWKRNVAERIAKNKRKLAEESIKINQVINNKQKLIGNLQKYYDMETIERELIDDTIRLKPDMADAFEKEIVDKFYKTGVMKMPEDGNVVKHFAEFIAELKRTRSGADRTPNTYKSIGELREFFEDKQMSNFFMNYERDGVKFVKSNAEMIRDIFDFNTSSIARFSEYGSTSPYVLANKFQYNLTNSFDKVYAKELGISQKTIAQALNPAIATIKTRAKNMFDHTQIGFAKEAQSGIINASAKARGALRRGILGFTGIPELTGQNYFIAMSRAQKYGGFEVYKTPMYQIRKMLKGSTEDLPLAKYNVAQMRKNIDFKPPRQSTGKLDTVLNKYDDVAFWFQETSDKQLKKFAESNSTYILHNLPDKFDKLENEMKDLLRKNNIDENLYKQFKDFTAKHIEENDFIVDMFTLSKEVETGSMLADSLRNVHYQLTDYIGNPLYGSHFNNRIMDEAMNWYGMFRTFSRNMNTDTFHRVMNYVDANGVSKTRFSLNYINDIGYKGVSKDIGFFVAGATMLGIGGYGYTMSKDLIQSDKTINQRFGIVKAKTDMFIDNLTSGDIIELAKMYGDWTGTNPFDMVKATDLPVSIYNSAKKVVDTFTDEEKIAFGTNTKEGTAEAINFIVNYFVSRVLNNQIKSLFRDDIYDMGKPYGLSKDGLETYEDYVRNSVYNQNFKRDMKIRLDQDMKIKQAEIDYSEGNNNSFDKLKEKAKRLGYKIIENNDIKDIDDFKQEYAIMANSTSNKEDLISAITNSRPEDNIDVQNTVDAINTEEENNKSEFSKLEPKKQDLFYLIMKYKGIDEPTEKDYDKFINSFKDAKTSQVSKLLDEYYNIKFVDFIQLYNNQELRQSAINYYK